MWGEVCAADGTRTRTVETTTSTQSWRVCLISTTAANGEPPGAWPLNSTAPGGDSSSHNQRSF